VSASSRNSHIKNIPSFRSQPVLVNQYSEEVKAKKIGPVSINLQKEGESRIEVVKVSIYFSNL